MIITGCMLVWLVFWVLEIALKIRDNRRSRGCRQDDDSGFGLSFITIRGKPQEDRQDKDK
jgi:hypothetical protein